MITFIDLCAGIGGGRLGLEKNGFNCIGFSEILPNSIKAYKFFHDTSNEKEFGDLTKISMNDIPETSMLIAGFPCQSYSIQGLRKGLNDERGQIIFDIENILKTKKINYFILENVKGLINHDKGNTINFILKLLNNAGYNVHYKVLRSDDYGLPQKRERVYFVGIRKTLPNTEYSFPKPYEQKSSLSEFLIEDRKEYEYKNFEWLTNYINNKYNN
jgi:DNA (cytosine-5)-methyltransferase 1